MRFYDVISFKDIPQKILAAKCLHATRELQKMALGGVTS